MEDKKIAMERYELRQLEITKKATVHFYVLIFLNILLAIPTLFEPGELVRGVCSLSVALVLSALVFFGVKFSTWLWVICAALQIGYYFFHVGLYLSKDYSMVWFLLMCARSAFCLYSGWAFVLNYDIQDVVREHRKKLFEKN